MIYGSLFYKFLLITKKSMCKYDYLIVGSRLFGGVAKVVNVLIGS